MKTPIFVSAVTRELRQTRQLGANILTRLGYEPVWQDVFGTEGGDLRQMLRDKIDGCDGLVHVVGRAYGAEPPQPDAEFGRVSYTQYELLYARKRGKKTWVVFVEDGFPTDKPPEQLDLPVDGAPPDPSAYQAERRGLQDAWRQKLRGETNLWYAAATTMEFELIVERLKDELRGLRRSFRSWQRAVLAILFVLLLLGGGLYWLLFRQRDDVQQVKQGQEEVKEQVKLVRDAVEERAKEIKEQWAKVRPDDIRAQLIKTIEETYQRELKEADALKDWKKRDEAKKDANVMRIKRLDRVGEFVESITSAIKSGEASPEFLEFTRIFQDQGPVEALKYIDTQKQRLLAEAEKLTQEKRKVLAPILGAIRVHVSRGEYPAARDDCEDLLRQDGDWPDALHKHVVIMDEIGDRAKKHDTIESVLAAFQAAEKSARRALELAPTNARAQRDLSFCLDSLGDATLKLGQTKNAFDYFRKSLDVRRALANADPENANLQFELCRCFRNLGDATLTLGRVADSLEFYRTCSQILRKLAQADPKNAEYQIELSASFDRLGNVTQQVGPLTDALDFYRKGWQILRDQAAADPRNARLQGDLGVSFGKLGDATLLMGQTKDALDFYRKCLDVDQRLADGDPKNAALQRDLLVSFHKLGNVTLQLGQTKDALEYYRKGNAIAQFLVDADPMNTQAQRDLSASFDDLGAATFKLGQSEVALDFYAKCNAIARRRADANPKDAQALRDLRVSFSNLGNATLKLGRTKDALDFYRKCLDIDQRLADGDPNSAQAQRGLMVSYYKLGGVQTELGNHATAIQQYELGIAVLDGMIERKLLVESAATEKAILEQRIRECKALIRKK